MNYSNSLQNPLYLPKPQKEGQDNDLRVKGQLSNMYQQNKIGQFSLKKPFTKMLQQNEKQKLLYKQPQMNSEKKCTEKALTTTSKQKQAEIIEQQNQDNEDFAMFKPQSCQINVDEKLNSKKLVREVGNVTYEPYYESEEIRHLTNLPAGCITEQSLMTILNPRLKYLNLTNHTWVPLSQISRIGFMAQNIEYLILDGLEITDDILIELADTCQFLIGINISSCQKLTSKGVYQFLKKKAHMLQEFSCAHLEEQITDETLKELSNCESLKKINLSFCKKLTNALLTDILTNQAQLEEIRLIALENLVDKQISSLIRQNINTLKILDLSFMSQTSMSNEALSQIGKCSKLEQLILTNNSKLSNGFVDSMIQEYHKLPSVPLKILKLGGVKDVSETAVQRLIQFCPCIELLELNQIDISDVGLEIILQNAPSLKKLFINFSVNVTQQCLDAQKLLYPNTLIVRNIIKMSDPKDDGLRMPFLNIKAYEARRKKKKKKKKK